ncbi:sensor histidine kinase [Harryflintia acetispora]|uniref:sensor histidine kinase n=1 Tax=Harryflintia acetispora TaxID=1849041 RepID=UPI002570769C|nr:HAMP domain-containing sensor histidine kinase [Harryflintia acetispora]
MKNKRKELSIKWKVFAYLSAFVGALLVLLWLFQIVFLDSFYQAIKTRAIKSASESIAKNIDDSDLQSYLEGIANRDDICVRILSTQGEELYSVDIRPDCMIHKLPAQALVEQCFEKAEGNGGTAFETFSTDFVLPPHEAMRDKQDGDGGEENWEKDRRGYKKKREVVMRSMIHAEIVTFADGTDAIILLNSVISPINATVETLRVQLGYITVILLVLSLFIALLLSRRVAEPIISINDSAKELARGRYDTRFGGRGYREVSELSDTLNYAAKELSKVEQLRRELIANISHDLRTPLTMITGYAEVMRDLPGENTPENVQIIIDEANRLSTLVSDVLDISKFQSGTQELAPGEFSLTALVREIIGRYGKLTGQEGYQIRFDYGAEVMVNADEVRLSQVIYNLINNAINYTGEDKSITVRQTVHEGRVRLEVIDNGAGIAADELPLIWDRYYKVDKAHKRAAVGSGLGLSIVRGILELHHADYGVESTPGKGSTFWFELPVL